MKQGVKKVLDGILKYQTSMKGDLLPIFREILDKPAPKSIIITSVDSRVNASRLAEPGAYFMIRNPGNFIPKYENESCAPGHLAASFELACVFNNASTVAVVGHSDCKTVDLLYSIRNNLVKDRSITENSALRNWLKENGKDTVEKFLEFEKSDFKKTLKFSECSTNQFEAIIDPQNHFTPEEKFSQINTLEQLKNVKNYSFLKDKINNKTLKGYALWLDINTNDVYFFSSQEKMFIKVDDESYEKIYQEASLGN